MVAAGGQDAPAHLRLHEGPDGNIEGPPAHVLADAHYLQLVELGCFFLGVQVGALEQGSLGHRLGQSIDIEVGDVALVSLEVGVGLHEPVELVSPGLPLEQHIFTHFVQLFLDSLSKVI